MNKNILPYILIFIAMIGSVYVGTSVAQEDYVFLTVIILVMSLFVIFSYFKQDIWIVMFVLTSWGGVVRLLPIPFSVANLAIVLYAGVWLLSSLSGKKQGRFNVRFLEIVAFIVITMVFIRFLLKPVGIASIGGSNYVGGRPYFELGVGILACVGLCSENLSKEWQKKIPKIILYAGLFLMLGKLVAKYLPSVGMLLTSVYSDFAPGATEMDLNLTADSLSVGRTNAVLDFGKPLAIFCAAYFAIYRKSYFSWSILGLVSGVILVVLSGYRSELVMVCAYCALTILVVRGFRYLIPFAVFGVGGILFVAGVHHFVYHLPDQVQRPFSFLPLGWDQNVIDDGENSQDWRYEMWEIALTSDEFIQNKWLGDGYGFDKNEYELGKFLLVQTERTPEMLREYYLRTGAYHSGPVSAIRFVGYIGLLVFTLLLIGLAWRSYKIIKTPCSPALKLVSTVLLIHYVIMPFEYWIIFGAFQDDVVSVIIGVGLTQLLINQINREQREDSLAQVSV